MTIANSQSLVVEEEEVEKRGKVDEDDYFFLMFSLISCTTDCIQFVGASKKQNSSLIFLAMQ